MRRRKLTALLAAAVMLFGCTSIVSAETVTTVGGTATANVTGTWVAGSSAGTVYSVDITWGSLSFTYTETGEGTWDPDTHSYEGATQAGWTCGEGANVIIITNHSNAAVQASLSYASNTEFTDITGSFDNSALTLATAVDTSVENAPTATAALTLSGALNNSTAADTAIGTVTITIGAAE